MPPFMINHYNRQLRLGKDESCDEPSTRSWSTQKFGPRQKRIHGVNLRQHERLLRPKRLQRSKPNSQRSDTRTTSTTSQRVIRTTSTLKASIMQSGAETVSNTIHNLLNLLQQGDVLSDPSQERKHIDYNLDLDPNLVYDLNVLLNATSRK
eukprot:219765-Amphidinium_carterae.1